MNLKTTLAGALVLLAPAATALAQEPGYGYRAPYTVPAPQRSTTQLRIVPPPGGLVYVYDGHRLLGRFDRPSALSVATGRSYRIVAARGDDVLWSGSVGATGAPIDLSWAAEQRTREPIMPRYAAPPRGYDEAQPRYYEQDPRYQEIAPPQASGYGGEIIPDAILWTLLRTLDQQLVDRDRLEAVSDAAARYAFTVPQVDRVLLRFRSDRYRLMALARVRDRLVDRADAAVLERRFASPSARAEARDLLAW